MTAAVIVETCQADGIKLSLCDGRILAKPAEKITPDRLRLLRDHKGELIEFLKSCSEASQVKDVGVTAPAAEVPLTQELGVAMPATARVPEGQPYRSFLYPDGRRLDLGKDEFDKIVRVFRLLNQQYERQGGLEEKEMFEPDASRNPASSEVKDGRDE